MVVDVKLVAKPHIAISTDTTIGKAPHYFDELPHEDEVRLGNLFKVLDLDGNGKIDIHDLSEALREFGLHHRYAQSFLERADANKSSDLSLAEFIQYVREHEKNLRLGFSHIDRNKDGKVDLEELIMAFKELGVDVEVNEAKKLLQRMDQDGSLEISFNEWRDFLLYAPSTDIHDLIRFWRHSTDIDHEGARHSAANRRPSRRRRDWNQPMRAAYDTRGASASVSWIQLSNPGQYERTVWHVGRKDAFSRRTASVLTPTMSSGAVVMEVTEEYLDIGEDMNVPDDFTQSEMQSGMWWRHLVAGGVAGAVSRTCTAPLDRLKVYLQVHGNKSTGIRKCLKHMLIEGGWLSLWRGNGINVLKIAPESALKFMAYEQLKRLIRQQSTARDLTIYERFVAGSLAGGFSQTIIYPLEVLKTRLALRKTGEFKSIMDAAMKIYKREGWKAFYKGYVPNLLGIIPYAGIDLAVYETLKNNYLRQHCDGEAPSAMLLLACGTASSTCGQVCSYPLALVRTKLQAQVITNVGSKINNHNTMTSLIKEIVREEGWAGLYRGITPNFMKVAPAVSISYVVYERCRQALGVNMT